MTVPRAGIALITLMQGCGLNTLGLADGSGVAAATTIDDDATTPSTPTSGMLATNASTESVGSSTGNGSLSDSSTGEQPPGITTLQLSFSQIKQFDFMWSAAAGATKYQLFERLTTDMDYGQIGEESVGTTTSLTMPLHFRFGASYRVRACGSGGCTDSEPVEVIDSMAAAIGYFKASNTDEKAWFGQSVTMSDDGNTIAVGAHGEATAAGAVYVFVRDGDNNWTQQRRLSSSNHDVDDYFGYAVTISGDGDTLVVGAYQEDSAATGIEGNGEDDSVSNAGAVYVFERTAGEWSQAAYIKASTPGLSDVFGYDVTVSADGNTLAVGAPEEDSGATGIGGTEADNSALGSGAVYIFVRDVNKKWSQQAYLKASNTDANDYFGGSIQLSADGDVLAVGAFGEGSGMANNEDDNSADNSGAVYVFSRDGKSTWSQQDYLKALNADTDDYFGHSVDLSADGSTIAVGAYRESSAAKGVGGNPADNSLPLSGAVYVFVQKNDDWSQAAYIKASNTGMSDTFGFAVALSATGDILAVGAASESSAVTGIGGNQANDDAKEAGAVYVFERDEKASWLQMTYVKAPNSGVGDEFGFSVAISDDGDTLAVGAHKEDSAAVGVGTRGNQANNSILDAGAVYLY